MMQLVSKIATAMRGGVREGLEQVVDANALRIFEQEIYECEQDLKQAKQQLAQVMVEKKRLQQQIDSNTLGIQHKEQQASKQLAQGHEADAMIIAQDIAAKEDLLSRQKSQLKVLQNYEDNLLNSLRQNTQHIEQYRNELRMAQATQQAQSVIGRLSKHQNKYTNQAVNLQDSLERIRQRQENFSDTMTAMQDIENYIAGETPVAVQSQQQAQAVLDRLKQPAN